MTPQLPVRIYVELMSMAAIELGVLSNARPLSGVMSARSDCDKLGHTRSLYRKSANVCVSKTSGYPRTLGYSRDSNGMEYYKENNIGTSMMYASSPLRGLQALLKVLLQGRNSKDHGANQTRKSLSDGRRHSLISYPSGPRLCITSPASRLFSKIILALGRPKIVVQTKCRLCKCKNKSVLLDDMI